ncbi:protein CNPPD1 isoform X2 [Drosophila eugracilis]|uniref:protein CNPPD1 isoform X2 n=1 Tax=Drosophila eugracilis TaxID=29029 RepID=UPI0007E70881|nr:protein CNPPD1 isoform X2 [Drosophila eugracilis]
MGRQKFIVSQKKVMKHDEFINRIRKSLYYGGETGEKDMELSLPFAEYAAEMFSEAHRGHSLHRLSYVAAAKVQATPCSLIMALIYLDRLNIIDPGYNFRFTPQELFVVSLMISTKFYAGHDERFYLEDWANKGNMTEDKLKEMELEFLSAMEWNIYISNEEFFDKLTTVERSLAARQGLRRGWLTYSELVQLLPAFVWTRFLVNSVSVLALSYAASVITLAGAFFIASQVPGTIWHREVHTASEAQAISSTLSNQTSSSSAPGDTSFVDERISPLVLNLQEEILKLERKYCAETSLNSVEYSCHQVVSSLPLTHIFPKLEAFSSQARADRFKMQYRNNNCQLSQNCLINIRSSPLENHWKLVQNGSVFDEMVVEALQQLFWLQRPNVIKIK